jgi:hypothetical protein
MSFQLYRVEVNCQSALYEWVKPVPLSGPGGPIARFVRTLGDDGGGVDWLLSGRELVGLTQPGEPAENYRILFDLEPGHEWRATLCELTSLCGSSRSDTTHLVLGFKTLFTGRTESPAAQFKHRFSVSFGASLPRFHEALRLLGGTSTGTWRWGEPQMTLGAAIVGDSGSLGRTNST